MKTNRLKNTMCYLCGPMDRVDDGGVGWRRYITPILKGAGVGVLDPSDKPTHFALEDDSFRSTVNTLKVKGSFDEVKSMMYMDIDSHMCGSYHEAFVSIQQKKPLLIVCKQGKENVPNWLFGVMPHEHMFSTFDDLIHYLGDVDSGWDKQHYNRWRFFDFEKIYN
jgi:hypothetical protein